MTREASNLILKKLKVLSKKEDSLSVNELRVIMAIESIIARLQADEILSSQLIFKGGFVLLKSYQSLRFTRDVDALVIKLTQDQVKRIVSSCLEKDVDDGFWFGDLSTKNIDTQGPYNGIRFSAAFHIGIPDKNKIHKLSRIHLDIGFNDKLISVPENQSLPLLLDHIDPVLWKVYPIEQIISEKLQILVDRRSGNSRAKDIYDLNFLLPKVQNYSDLIKSIQKTLLNRKTEMPVSFFNAVASFEDLTFLKNAWNSVKIGKEKPDFVQAWDILLNNLKKLDAYRLGRVDNSKK